MQREELIFLLNGAAELEHSLACSYLFTAFSLKSNPSGPIRCRHAPLLAHKRMTLPVLGGISGW